MRERGENEKEGEELKASFLKTLLMSKNKVSLQCLFGDFIAKPPLQNTKKTKTNTITMGEN